jgi:site-specific DNA-adenine methylase
VYKLYTFFVGGNALVLPLQHFNFISNQIVLTTMKQMLNRMLRYADAIVKRGVDKLIDAIAHSAEPQSEKTETPQQKSMGNNTDCAPQTTGHTTNCGLTEQAITLMDELYDIRYNVLDRTPEVQRRDQADKGFVPVSKLVRNTMVIDLHDLFCSFII